MNAIEKIVNFFENSFISTLIVTEAIKIGALHILPNPDKDYLKTLKLEVLSELITLSEEIKRRQERIFALIEDPGIQVTL